jgi:hypothetical protein
MCVNETTEKTKRKERDSRGQGGVLEAGESAAMTSSAFGEPADELSRPARTAGGPAARPGSNLEPDPSTRAMLQSAIRIRGASLSRPRTRIPSVGRARAPPCCRLTPLPCVRIGRPRTHTCRSAARLPAPLTPPQLARGDRSWSIWQLAPIPDRWGLRASCSVPALVSGQPSRQSSWACGSRTAS